MHHVRPTFHGENHLDQMFVMCFETSSEELETLLSSEPLVSKYIPYHFPLPEYRADELLYFMHQMVRERFGCHDGDTARFEGGAVGAPI